jgi:hypothetical protein
VSTAFLLTTLVIVATPGTGVLYTLAAGLSRGSRASVVAAFGCTLGIVQHSAKPAEKVPVYARGPCSLSTTFWSWSSTRSSNAPATG